MPSRLRSETGQSIWWIVIAPAVWGIHFLASYLTAAIFCAKYAVVDDSARQVQQAIGIYTAVGLFLIGWIGAIGFRRHRSVETSVPHDAPTRADQRRLIGWATFLLSCLSAVAILFTALVAVFVGSCD